MLQEILARFVYLLRGKRIEASFRGLRAAFFIKKKVYLGSVVSVDGALLGNPAFYAVIPWFPDRADPESHGAGACVENPVCTGSSPCSLVLLCHIRQ